MTSAKTSSATLDENRKALKNIEKQLQLVQEQFSQISKRAKGMKKKESLKQKAAQIADKRKDLGL